jgi:hypothetical protein
MFPEVKQSFPKFDDSVHILNEIEFDAATTFTLDVQF